MEVFSAYALVVKVVFYCVFIGIPQSGTRIFASSVYHKAGFCDSTVERLYGRQEQKFLTYGMRERKPGDFRDVI
jgi:hypothetical protein